MIPSDLAAELSRLLASAAAVGEFPALVTSLTANGTWRWTRADAIPGTYTTSLPFRLAKLAGGAPGAPDSPDALAAWLADRLATQPWIGATRADGGYLTIVVSPAHLARLPARIVAAGPAAARSEALAGRRLTAPEVPDLATAPSLAQAWRSQRAALVGKLAAAAGADIILTNLKLTATSESSSPPSASPASARPPSAGPVPAANPVPPSAGQVPAAGPALPASTVPASPVPAAIAYYGADAMSYTLARTGGPSPAAIEAQLRRPLDLSNPFVLVRHAHADAASTLRWAAELELITGAPSVNPLDQTPPTVRPQPAEPQSAEPLPTESPPTELEPIELKLIETLSWLPERVAAACRRNRPADLAVYLEHLAAAWLECAQSCPALSFRGRNAPPEPAGTLALARLELAEAVRTTLAAGLGLLAVPAPARI